MARWPACLVPCAAALILAPGAAADAIFVPSQAPSITAALAGAVDGDVIVIAKGSYHELVDIDGLGVSLVANGLPVLIDSITVRNLSAGQTVLLQKLEVGPINSDAFEDHDGITCVENEGSIRIQQCTAVGDAGDAGILALPQNLHFDGGDGLSLFDCADVTAIHSTFRGGQGATLDDEDVQLKATQGGHGISVRGSRLALHDVHAEGAMGGFINDTTTATGATGGSGVLNVSGEVHASGCTFVGGNGGSGDCDFFLGSCGHGGAGGDGIRQTTALASLTVRDNTYDPGDGGGHGDGSGSGTPGADVTVLAGTAQPFPAPHRVLHLNSPVFEGKPIQLIVEGQPGDLALLHLGFAPGWLPKAAYQGVYQITPPAILVVLGVLTGPSLSLTSTAPELGPGIEHLAADAQLIIGAGSDVLLGGAKTLVLLNSP